MSEHNGPYGRLLLSPFFSSMHTMLKSPPRRPLRYIELMQMGQPPRSNNLLSSELCLRTIAQACGIVFAASTCVVRQCAAISAMPFVQSDTLVINLWFLCLNLKLWYRYFMMMSYVPWWNLAIGEAWEQKRDLGQSLPWVRVAWCRRDRRWEVEVVDAWSPTALGGGRSQTRKKTTRMVWAKLATGV